MLRSETVGFGLVIHDATVVLKPYVASYAAGVELGGLA
jgi:hypothetical protein